VHFAIGKGEPSGEEAMNTTFLKETCREAGWPVKTLFIEQVALSPDGRFYDHHGKHIDVIFKLYPWEWMVKEQFGKACFRDMENIGLRNDVGEYVGGTIWIEAPYKMLWSNKALLAILWELHKDDPRSKWLLPTYFEDQAPPMTKYARKPIFSREGDGILLQGDERVIQNTSRKFKGKEGFIVQELALPPEFKNTEGVSYFPVLGLWFIDGDPAGMGIRESKVPITTNTSMFIPHSISDAPLNYEKTPIPDISEIEAALTIQQHGKKTKGDDALGHIERLTI
jgi:glutathionylspermidine synthase